MRRLFKYLFASIYNYFNNSSTRRKNAVIYTSFIVSLPIIFNLAVLISVAFFLAGKHLSILFTNYFVVISFLIFFSTILYFRSDWRFLKILQQVESYSSKQKIELKVVSSIYFIFSLLLYLTLVILNIKNVVLSKLTLFGS